ncbi:MAG: hypothetical protein NTY99_02215, partial [DPANN group archaeon]|nr:hypothetical protein [DPANN group archaeon]
FWQMFSKSDKIEILDKYAELRGIKGEGKLLGRGFSTQIWNNGLENITDKDLENYINPLIKFIEEHPKQAKIEGLYKGNFQNWIRVR